MKIINKFRKDFGVEIACPECNTTAYCPIPAPGSYPVDEPVNLHLKCQRCEAHLVLPFAGIRDVLSKADGRIHDVTCYVIKSTPRS